MEREILFRGKRVDDGEWVYGVPLFDWAPCSLKCKNQHNGALLTFFGWNDEFHEYEEFEVDPATVGQYTGLTDKNGVKIFEGDIISYNGSKEVVYFDTSLNIPCFTTGIGRGSSTGPHPYKISKRHVVIGNIHDNHQKPEETT